MYIRVKKGSESKRTVTKKEKRNLEQSPRIGNKGHSKSQLPLIKKERGTWESIGSL